MIELTYRMGNNIWSKGLSTLKPTKVTVSSLQLTLWDNLMLGVGYEFNKNNISYVYYQDASGINTTAVNNNLSKWGFMAMYDWQISQSLSFVNSINIDRIKLHYESDTKHFTNVIIDSKLDWFIKKLDFVASIEYSKNLARNPWVQGYNETEQDIWEISLRKSFLNKRLNLSLDYCPPIRLFVHDEQKKVINTPFYKETQRLNLHTYDNLLMFRVIFNLHKGVKGNIKDVNTKFINEEQKGRGLL